MFGHGNVILVSKIFSAGRYADMGSSAYSETTDAVSVFA